MPNSETNTRTRREFFANVVMGSGLLLGLGGLAARFAEFLYPVVPPQKLIKALAGKLSDIPKGGARMFNPLDAHVMIVDDGTQLLAFSAVCTHLGCLVHWDSQAERFVCPCHHGVYDTDGNVVSGPPPRPLERIKLAIEGDQIFVFLAVREEPT